MQNPYLLVKSAFYGTPANMVNVTGGLQSYLDAYYVTNPSLTNFPVPVTPGTFGITDPAPGVVKSFTLEYGLEESGSGVNLLRAGKDFDIINITAVPCNTFTVLHATYATNSASIEITSKLQTYLDDPSNCRSLTVGSPNFLSLFCKGIDPYIGALKYFSASIRNGATEDVLYFAGKDGQTLIFSEQSTFPNQNWMRDMARAVPRMASTQLRKICLPSSHDSATYYLESKFTSDPEPWIKSILKIVSDFNETVNFIPHISEVINPATWAYNDISNVCKNLATATTVNILQQLNDGIRVLDLRIYYNAADSANPFYTYHGLVGVPLVSVLSEIELFLTYQSKGEIVYVTMGHYLDDDAPDKKFTSAQKTALFELVSSQFADAQIFKPAQHTGNLLEATYSEIVGTSPSSKVILVMDGLDSAQRNFWATDQYSPVDPGSRSYIASTSTNDATDNVSALITAQQNCSKQAGSKAFALSLTLTPTTTVAAALVALALENTIWVVTVWLVFIPFIGMSIATALGLIVITLQAAYITGKILTYSSLRELSRKIFSGTDVKTFINSNFIGSTYAVPSFIYTNFYEDNFSQNADGHNVSQLVEVAKSITKNSIS